MNKKVILIGISGKADCGKSHAADLLWRHINAIDIPFAARVKDTVSSMFGIDRLKLEDRVFKETVLEPWGIPPRKMLQDVGQAMKREFGDDIWVKLWYQSAKEVLGCMNVVASDVRFEQEAAKIRALGGHIIHIERPDAQAAKGNSDDVSERGIQVGPQDFTLLNDGSVHDFEVNVLSVLDLIYDQRA